MSIGSLIAAWLHQRIDPSGVYDHRILHELQSTGALTMPTGELVFVPTYSPAELMRHPIVEVRGIADTAPEARSTLGWEIADVLHRLLWPLETPPGDVRRQGWIVAFQRNVQSISERDTMPYRNNPPGGWWR